MTKWRLRHLLFSWFAYWIAIIAIKLGPAIAAGVRATSGPSDGQSKINAGWSDAAGLTVEIVEKGVKIYSGTASLASIIGWAVVPPLVLWAAWLAIGAKQRRTQRERELLGEGSPGNLPMRDRIHSTPDRR